jgi:phosphoglycerate dehydrogenase-like enzyme
MKAVMYPYGPHEPVVALTRDFPELQWSVVSSPEELAREIGGASIYVTSNRVCNPATGAALRLGEGSLRWVHFTSAGFERGVAMGLPKGVVVTNSTGVKATMVSEHALTLLLALVRRIPDVHAGQRGRRWLREETNRKVTTLEHATVCIVGLGNIGREIARKLKAFDARPIAVSRAGAADGDVAAVYPRERIREALALADAVVISTSGDETSLGLVGMAELAAMKPTAFIVNVARGNIIAEAALIEALQQGRLAGAGLDVAEIEPLPADSPLWDMPNVIISPHIAGGGSTGYPRHKKLFTQNLERLRAGRPLVNECRIANSDPSRAYR